RRERSDRALSVHRWLAYRGSRVRRHPLPLASALKYAVEQRDGLASRDDTDPVGAQLELEPLDRLGSQIAKGQAAKPRKDVRVPEHRVQLQRLPSEVRLGIQRPPLRPELGEC